MRSLRSAQASTTRCWRWVRVHRARLPYKQTSYSNSSGTTVVNQDEDVYNGLQQLATEYQEQSGAVNTSTSLKVQYAYSSLASGSLLDEMIYPNGRILHFGYDNSALDTAIGRVDYLADDNGSGSAGSHLVDYTYQGLDAFVGQAYVTASMKPPRSTPSATSPR